MPATAACKSLMSIGSKRDRYLHKHVQLAQRQNDIIKYCQSFLQKPVQSDLKQRFCCLCSDKSFQSYLTENTGRMSCFINFKSYLRRRDDKKVGLHVRWNVRCSCVFVVYILREVIIDWTQENKKFVKLFRSLENNYGVVYPENKSYIFKAIRTISINILIKLLTKILKY